jgi:hypothetical protein
MTAETYEGKPCASGHTTRYRSNRKCVRCHTLPVRYFAVLDGDVYASGSSPEVVRRLAPEDATLWRATPIDG